MGDDKETRKHPLWQEVVDLIAADVKERGRGIVYSHKELHDWLDIPFWSKGDDPKEQPTWEEGQAYQFNYMSDIEALRDELLEVHHIYLKNVRSQGYLVMTPDDQIKDGPDAALSRARALTVKASQILLCVEQEMLSQEMKNTRIEKMTKVAFIRGTFQKRKFPKLSDRDQKRLLESPK